MRRSLDWASALRDLRADRTGTACVREERLNQHPSIAHTISLTAWRGQSGRRYVVRVEPIKLAAILDGEDSVVLAVCRDDDGHATILAATLDLPDSRLSRWALTQAIAGANEIHVHRLAEDADERAAIVDDLTGSLPNTGRAA